LSISWIRPVTLRQASAPVRVQRSRAVARRRGIGLLGLPAATPESAPVLWRELYHRQPSRWSLAVWRLFGGLSILCSVLTVAGGSASAPGTSAFIVSIGLLLVTVGAATVLAEERAHGSLEVLLTTPLETKSIVMGKWWGAFRPVPRLA